MKNLKLFTMLAVVMGLFFTSCSKDSSETGVDDSTDENFAVLTFGSVLNDFQSRDHYTIVPECDSDATADFAYIQFTVDGGDLQSVLVPLITDGSDIFTAYSDELKIMIPMGESSVDVVVETFSVHHDANDNGSIEGAEDDPIWVAPLEGSEFAEFVSDPLPMDITLRAGAKPYSDVEVLCFDDRMVIEYGYQFFDLFPIRILEGCFFVNYCTEAGRHYVGSYMVSIYSEEGGELIWSETNTVNGDGEDAQADPLCATFPDRVGEDDSWYIEVILLEGSPGYDGEDMVIWGAEVTDTMVMDQFVGEDSLEYWHITYGCE